MRATHEGNPRVAIDDRVRELQLHRQRHELLLHPVMEIALELAALFVLGGDEALAGRPELLDQAHVAQYRAGLCGEVAHEALLRRVHRIARRHRDRQGAQWLAAVAHLDRVDGTGGGRLGARGPRGGGPDSSPNRSQTVAASAPVPSPSVVSDPHPPRPSVNTNRRPTIVHGRRRDGCCGGAGDRRPVHDPCLDPRTVRARRRAVHARHPNSPTRRPNQAMSSADIAMSSAATSDPDRARNGRCWLNRRCPSIRPQKEVRHGES